MKNQPLKRAKKLLLLCLGCVVFCSVVKAQNPLQSKIEEQIRKSQGKNALWSISVRDSLGNEQISINSGIPVRPASNLKLITSAAILDGLGPDYSFETNLYGDGQLMDGTWFGDLFFVGKGDPSIGGELYNDDKWYVFDHFIDQMRELGITSVQGILVGNDSFFDDEPYPKGWDWDDLSFYYGVEIGALSFNRNSVDLEVRTEGTIGKTPEITWFPFNTDYVTFINQQVITPKNTHYEEYYRRMPGTNTILLKSNLPKGYVETESLSISGAASFFVDTFQKYAQISGIEWDGGYLTDRQNKQWEKEPYRLIASHRSRPLTMMLPRMNQNSDNFYTEMLVKTLAAEKFLAPGSTEAGLKVVKQFVHKAGVDTSFVVMKDGSGMSAGNLIRTSDLTKVLHYVSNQSYSEHFQSSLSKPTVNGTLKNRFTTSVFYDALMGKSGFMSGTRTISGYLRNEKGERLSFSIATNNYVIKTASIDLLHQQILELIYKGQ